MRFPLSWLKTWVDVPAELGELQKLLMRAGIGLEAVEDPGASLREVVVARVLERSPHPDAQRLSLCRVTDGAREYSIVCGAPNVEAGITVPLAKEGAELPGGMRIKRSKIRGVASEGMLCSAEELGLPGTPGVDGLMLLEPSLAPGTPLAAALGLDDPVLTLETTANRPDHLSLRGLAREVAALGGLALKDPTRALAGVPAAHGASPLAVSADPALCPYYTARVLRGVAVGPSPAWMRSFLEKAGIRPINLPVDATNFVLVEYGQPMHAFDLARLEGPLAVRAAADGERLTTLDGQERALDPADTVVADGRGPQALAGIMGGAHSAVSAETRDLVLEAAVFPAKAVRRTSRRLGLHSESSRRFERGVDPRAVDEAMDRCVALILAAGGGGLDGERARVGAPGAAPGPVVLRPARVNALLGSAWNAGEMAELMRRRAFAVEPAAGPGNAEPGELRVTPPSWRGDVRGEADLAEELLQMAGVDSLPGTELAAVRAPDPDDEAWANGRLVRARLAALGLREASTLSYLDPGRAEAWGLSGAAPTVDNPLSAELSRLRPSLLPGLAEAAFEALRRGRSGAAFFEWGTVFVKGPQGVRETPRLGVVLAGEAAAAHWLGKARAWDFHDLKGLAESLAASLGLTFRAAAAQGAALPSWAHPGRCAAVSLGGLQGTLAALHPALLGALDAPRGLGEALALELEPLNPAKPLAKDARYTPFPRVPAVERDLSCLLPPDLPAGKVLDFLRTEGGLSPVRLLDLFQGPPLPADRRSLTFRLTYASEERSLTDAEVNARHEDLIRRLETALPVEVRR